MNIDYSQFYRGTTNIPSYGSGAYKKDTLVKYEFNTTDEHGNKVMDKMSREETLQAMKDIRSQYGDSVIVEFSGDGLAALAGGGKFMSGRAMTEEEAAKRAARDAAFQAENVIQHENTHRIVIPNYETNEQLYNSLAGAGDNVISSTMGIISNYFMPGDASGLSEQERQALKESEVELSPTGKENAYTQRFYLYLNLTKPSEKLYLSYSKTSSEGNAIRPSYFIGTMKKLFPRIREVDEEIDCPSMNYITTPEGAKCLA